MTASETIDGVEITFRHVVTNGVRLHCAVAGPEDGPLVLALHGFPEFWRGMAGTMVALAKAGFRIIAPDQRGYHLSEKPRGIDAYRIEELAADAVGLIHAFGRERAHVVGHDWGAGVAWWMALAHPESVDRLVILNVPHPSVFAKEVRTNRRQTAKSWYIFAIQPAGVAEAVAFNKVSRPRFMRMLAGTANPGSWSEEYQQQLLQAWAQPGAATGMLNWYRASVRRRPGPLEDKRVHRPTLIIWGRQDVALSESMVEPSAAYCDDVRVEFLDDATHWVLHDEPERTAELIIDFLTATA
jgi:pimeloyl-ACP methyl ester carboxylesterase